MSKMEIVDKLMKDAKAKCLERLKRSNYKEKPDCSNTSSILKKKWL